VHRTTSRRKDDLAGFAVSTTASSPAHLGAAIVAAARG